MNNFLNVWNEIRNTYLLDKGKLNTYFKYKTSFNLENYLIVKNRHILTKFRLSNHTIIFCSSLDKKLLSKYSINADKKTGSSFDIIQIKRFG
jgi:hypothetical protein